VVWLAPRVPGDSVRPRRLSGVVVRPLNFTVGQRGGRGLPAREPMLDIGAKPAAGVMFRRKRALTHPANER